MLHLRRAKTDRIDAAQHGGRISKQGRSHARGMLVEAAWAAAVTPGPLRAFYVRVQGRKRQAGRRRCDRAQDRRAGWHLLTKEEDYAFARLALVAIKERQMQLKASAKSRRGGNTAGKARDYSIKKLRDKERAVVEQAEKAYTRFVTASSKKAETQSSTQVPSRCGAEYEVGQSERDTAGSQFRACPTHPCCGSWSGAGRGSPCAPARRPRSRR